MTQLLIQGSTILAQGPFTGVEDESDSIHSVDAIYPKHVIEWWQIVECEVPDGFAPAGYTWDGAAVVEKPPVVVPLTKDEIIAKIDQLERDSMMNRGVRELSLRLMEQQAAAIAQAQGTTQDAILATVPAYVKFKALDDQITALRAQL